MDKKKELKDLIISCDLELTVMSSKVSAAQRDLAMKKKELKSYQIELDKLENKVEIGVSDHALVRYMERVMGVDTDALRKEILTEKVVNYIHYFKGSGSFPAASGISYIVKDYVITTIINKNDKKEV